MSEEKFTPGLNPVYQLDFALPVWQLHFDVEEDWIALECRNPETLQVSYAVVDVASGIFLLNNYQPPNSWWTGLADIKNELLFLHQMGAKGMGQASGLIAVAVTEGTVKWQNPDYCFYGLVRNKLFVRPVKSEFAALLGLKIETGEPTGEVTDILEIASELESYQTERLQTISLPMHYPVESAYFSDLKQFIQNKTGFISQWAIDYLESPDLIITGFYPQFPSGEKNYQVAVFSRQGELLVQEELGKNLTGLSIDNFFVFREKLFLLKNKKSLLAFRF